MKMRTTPDMVAASAVSIPAIRPCASGLRTKGGVNAVRGPDIVGEAPLPGQERPVLDAQARLPDAAGRCG